MDYVDLEILASVEDDYLVRVSKETLNALTQFNEFLTVRHWDGKKPVILEPYGETAVRTKDDDSLTNNLEELPSVDASDLLLWIMGGE